MSGAGDHLQRYFSAACAVNFERAFGIGGIDQEKVKIENICINTCLFSKYSQTLITRFDLFGIRGLFTAIKALWRRESKKQDRRQNWRSCCWRRVRDSNPGCFVSTQHFECCTFDHSDNSPDITNVLEFVLELRESETRRIAENRVK